MSRTARTKAGAGTKLRDQIAARASKQFTAEEFRAVTRSHFFMGAASFWREVERLTQIEETIRVHAHGVLRMMAESEYRDCRGLALSPQHAEALTFCGLTPLGVRAAGIARQERDAMIVRHGLGLITSSNFYVPQVNLPGSMARFVEPAGIPAVPLATSPQAAGSAMHKGLGQGIMSWNPNPGPAVLVNPFAFQNPIYPATTPATTAAPNWLPWAIGGGLVLVMMMARR